MNKMKELTKWKGIDVHRLEDSILLRCQLCLTWIYTFTVSNPITTKSTKTRIITALPYSIVLVS